MDKSPIKPPDTFIPDEKFIKHIDSSHEKTLEKKDLDPKYQEEFSLFFRTILKEVGFKSLPSFLSLKKGDGGAYITWSSMLKYAFMSSEKEYWDRINMCISIEGKFNRATLEEGAVENNKIITQLFREKINFTKLLSCLDDEDIDQAKKNLLIMILQIMDPDCIPKRDEKCSLKQITERLYGTHCLAAEKHMLAYISGEHINPEGGYINVITNEDDLPIMIEKIGLGYSHSCITIQPIRLGGKYVPSGSLLETIPGILEPIKHKMRWFTKKEGAFNYITKADDYKGFKFMRFSILSIPPEIRAQAGGEYYLHQQNKTNGYINYDWITPEVISEHIKERFKKSI